MCLTPKTCRNPTIYSTTLIITGHYTLRYKLKAIWDVILHFKCFFTQFLQKTILKTVVCPSMFPWIRPDQVNLFNIWILEENPLKILLISIWKYFRALPWTRIPEPWRQRWRTSAMLKVSNQDRMKWLAVVFTVRIVFLFVTDLFNFTKICFWNKAPAKEP